MQFQIGQMFELAYFKFYLVRARCFSNFIKPATLIKSRLTTLKTQVSTLEAGKVLSEADIAKIKTIYVSVIKKNNGQSHFLISYSVLILQTKILRMRK